MPHSAGICFFVPSHILNNVAKAAARDNLDPSPAQRSAVISTALRQQRRREAPQQLLAGLTTPNPGTASRQIYDDQNLWAFDVDDVRNEGDPAVEPENANLAYDGLGATRDFYKDFLGRNSLDNLGLNIVGNVNFGVSYDNAFWDGQRMVFGNGDNFVFVDFTGDIDVAAHELTHGVTQYAAGLDYTNDQSGALNEATSDIFGTVVDVRVNGTNEATHDWLIGEGIMAPQLQGEAIRSMAEPGTAFDNPIMGKDPQPRDMSGFVPGGDPHLNSGIINRWWYLMAQDLGIDAAALLWYQTLQQMVPLTQFADAVELCARQARILTRNKKLPARAVQTVRGTARQQQLI